MQQTMQNITSSLQQGIKNLKSTNMLSSFRNVAQKGFENLRQAGTSIANHINTNLKSEFEIADWLSVEGMFYFTTLSVIIISCLVLTVNIYRKIRYAIPVSVNCWFCNNNTKVSYTLRTTWTCPTCHQYNGFTSDGGYNKRMLAQSVEALNRPIRGAPAKGYQLKPGGPNSNGLCSQCNLNQVLKVFQLSSFVPVNEKNFDAEAEAEQKRLEQLYEICSQCKQVVEQALKRTPEKQQLITRRKGNIKRDPAPTWTPTGQSGLLGSSVAGTSPFTVPRSQTVEDDYPKDISDISGETDSASSFLSLNNLKIDSQRRNNGLEEYYLPPISSSTPVPTNLNFSTPNFAGCSTPFQFPGNSTFNGSRMNNEMPPLWKDYPMVHNGLSRTFSVLDTMSCPPIGTPAYIAANGTLAPPPPQFNYQSSSMGSVFGGRKPLISPPKLNNMAPAQAFTPYIRYGAYYDITAAPASLLLRNNPMAFSPQSHYYANPISRSSSQSSGFVSQQGGVAAPTPPPQQIPSFPAMNNIS